MQQVKRIKKNTNIHIVYLTDEVGIFKAFDHIKEELSNETDRCLSFIYAVTDLSKKFLFQTELNLLEKRFYHDLLIYYVTINPESNILAQDFLEAIINSNTKGEIQFIVFGQTEFIEQVSNHLLFLSINQNQISYQII